jgi:hypothetical protein
MLAGQADDIFAPIQPARLQSFTTSNALGRFLDLTQNPLRRPPPGAISFLPVCWQT